MNSLFLRHHLKTLCNKVEWSLTWARPMGGGGKNKWKYRRLHEKKQLEQARLRSRLRASTNNVSPQPDPDSKSHRFVKPGAEDLWNDADGPRHEATALTNFQQKRGYSSSLNFNLQPRRGFSSFEPSRKPKKRRYRGSSSDDDDDEDYGELTENARWPKFSAENPKSKDDDGRRKGARGFIGSDVFKVTKKKIIKELEDAAEKEDTPQGLMERVEEIRQEVLHRKLAENTFHQNVDAQADDELADDFASTDTDKRFDQCAISPLTVEALTNAGYITMSKLQQDTLSLCLKGNDALVKAKAGPGKTTAFLLPAIETVLMAISSDKVQRVPPIYVLVLCPTRELASQIAAETRALLKYHDGLGVQVISGGTRFKDDLTRLELDPCQILVATTGRLLDHVEARSGLCKRLMGLKLLVLDEADHLLDLGFKKDMERIVDCLPCRRQSLLFSATVTKEVRRFSQLVLKREHVCINTEDENCPETNSKVKQSYVIVPHDMHFQVVYKLLKKHISEMPDYKVIVFCTTGMVTSLMYLLFREMRMNVREIHSRKPQFYRSRIADEFKQSKRLILISSDVSARGMNYPDVSLVIQVGIPSDRLQYIHCIGRTGREGKDGEGILVLAPWEEHFLEEIRDLHVEKSSAPLIGQDVKLKMEDSMSKVDTSVKEAAYLAWLGYYNSLKETGRDKTSLVKWANQFCVSIGLQKTPALFRKTVVKMGLKDIPGIHLKT